VKDKAMIERPVEKIYRLLLRLYPTRFRKEYAEEMAQVFRDLCRDVDQKKGKRGLVLLSLRSLFDLLKNCLEEWMMTLTGSEIRQIAKQVSVFLRGMIALCLTWFLIFWVVFLFAPALLAPWNSNKLPHGSLVRSINAFFELQPGLVVPSWIMVAIGVVLFLRAVRVKGLSPVLPWRFALINAVFAFAHFAVIIVAGLLTNLLMPDANGYSRSIIPLLLEIAVIAVYIRAQFHVENPSHKQKEVA
jgi:hypothetical protein